jgi:glutamate-1-semialdehyde aminotransferase
MTRYQQSDLLIERALRTIPLGSQTFSKSIAQFPRGVSPLFITHGQGSHVWDVDENEYVDFINGLLSISIGYNDPDIISAVKHQLDNGVIFSLPHPLEMEVAELLVELVPCAEKVRFGKNGTDVTSAAIRLARAYTNREHILVCGYHGWQDWYIGSTTRDLGVPKAVKELTHVFQYNDIHSLEKLFDRYPNEVAAVIMEPMNVDWPEEGYLERVKELTHESGAVLIFDEIITGCRVSKGGAQELFGITPDLATFGKGLANGFPLSAIVGKEEIMNVMEDIFFSGTFGGETLSLAAAKAVLQKVKNGEVVEQLYLTGKLVLDGVQTLIEKHNLTDMIHISGHPSWTILTIMDTNQFSSLEIKTLFLQEVFKRGILTIGTHNISCAHTENDVDFLLQVYDEVFSILRKSVNNNTLVDMLETTPLAPIFKVR